MKPNEASITRRNFSLRIATLFSAIGVAAVAGRSIGSAHAADTPAAWGLGHDAEAIHHERVFKASRKRVYDALTDNDQFDQVVRLSGAMQGLPAGSPPNHLSASAGGDFLLFGGYISGRIVELVLNERVVQAWRTASWKPGAYSIARFELVEQGADTRLIFDQTGFPQGLGTHLAPGWIEHYWDPVEKFLS
jgi:uncharacterized protein YndB with AHSA1/START domain